LRAFLLTCGVARTVVVNVQRTTFVIETFRPRDVVHEGEATNEIAIFAVKDVEETVTVGSSTGLNRFAVFLVVE